LRRGVHWPFGQLAGQFPDWQAPGGHVPQRPFAQQPFGPQELHEPLRQEPQEPFGHELHEPFGQFGQLLDG
jgi:hypothetical protein